MSRTLADIPLSRVWMAQQRAQLRIQIYAIGETHKLLGEFGREAQQIILANAGTDGKLTAVGLYHAKEALHREWTQTLNQWKRLTHALRREAASLPFGVLAVYQDKWVNPALKKLGVTESANPTLAPVGNASVGVTKSDLAEASPMTDYVFQPQLQGIMDASASHIYGDGLDLSERIWGFNSWATQGIDQTLYAGMAGGTSAWDIAKNMEQFLGYNQDCQRWTSTRLYKLDKKDIVAGDTTGLYSGADCAGQGVAYNALRMARTEIQYVHGQATDQIMSKMPWIEQERIYLSHAHPEQDMCDDVVNGGQNGKGIYPVGTITLPLHPHCLCLKEAVQPDEKAFVNDLRAWMQGGSSATVNEYAAVFGKNSNSFGLMDLAQGFVVNALADWLWGSPAVLAGRVLGIM